MLTPQTLLNQRYEIIRLIGQGGMGAVYEALDQRLRARVALKQTTVSGDQLSRAFEREAQLLAGLRHAALPRVIDHFVTPEGQFLVMDFIQGEDLATMLKMQSGPFPLEQVLGWADQLLDALAYLHSQQPPVVHRDIKPQNLKLTPRGEIILLDFGLAKGIVPLATQAEGAGASIFGYTPQYAPIEQVQGTGTGPRSDLYSLAATLYHLLTAQAPPDTLTRAEAVLNNRPDPLQSAHTLNPNISPVLAGALSQAMALRADERFATAVAMRRALHQAAEAAPPANTGPTLVARHPQTQVATPRMQPPVSPTPAPPPPRPQEAYSQPQRRSGWLPLILLVLVLVAGSAGATWFFMAQNRATATLDPTTILPTTSNQPQPTIPAPVTEVAVQIQPTIPATASQPKPALPEAQAISLDARIVDEIVTPGQYRTYRFEVEPNTQIFVWTADYDQGMSQIKLRVLDSQGDEIANTCMGCGQMGTVTLKQGGAYTLLVGSDREPATGAFEIRINRIPPTSNFSIPIDSRLVSSEPGPGAGEIEVPGAKDAYTFEATPGQQVFVWTADSDDGMSQIKLVLLDSVGDVVDDACMGCGNMGTVTLKKGGTYTLLIGSDKEPATGAYEVRLNAIPLATTFDQTLPATLAGSINVPGATQIYRFEAAPGQQIFVTTVGYDEGMSQIKLVLLDSLGDEVDDACLGCGNMGAVTLRKGGIYTMVVGSIREPATGAYEIRIDLP
ncbi:serine/threonine protein kinase [Candidatus Oscillochloris fontis]|uniref:serine/threonine protein kinase n=1 Tax=Candidatus Oscillochloris fontis TaxID=2496868 RepID=UPI00101D7BC4|nr:serine/threonine-protein kinase [Candidatus Oscillochloris fontis]